MNAWLVGLGVFILWMVDGIKLEIKWEGRTRSGKKKVNVGLPLIYLGFVLGSWLVWVGWNA